MKTFIEEYGVIIVAAIAILALVAIATATSEELGNQIIAIVTSFTDSVSSSALEVTFGSN